MLEVSRYRGAEMSSSVRSTLRSVEYNVVRAVDWCPQFVECKMIVKYSLVLDFTSIQLLSSKLFVTSMIFLPNGIFISKPIYDSVSLLGLGSSCYRSGISYDTYSALDELYHLTGVFFCHTILRFLTPAKSLSSSTVLLTSNRSKFLSSHLDPSAAIIVIININRPIPHTKTYIAPTYTQKPFSNMKRASKGYTGVDIPVFPTMLVQGPIVQDEGLTVPVENMRFLSPDILLRPLQQMRLHPQGWMSDMEGLPLLSGHGSGNIDKTPTMPYDSPLLRVYTLGSDEGIMQHNELMDLVTKLSDIVGRHGQEIEFKTEVYSTEDVSTAGATVTTAGDSISIASPLRVSTAEDISTAETLMYIRRSASKDKAIVRLLEQLDEEERKRIARVHKEASSFNIEEWEDIQATIEADEEITQRIKAEEKEKYPEDEKARLLAELINQRKRYFA
ncbi:hypothetical protein Tco_0662509 [Tanacetum coccineum]